MRDDSSDFRVLALVGHSLCVCIQDVLCVILNWLSHDLYHTQLGVAHEHFTYEYAVFPFRR
jgi:hypothetical protein